MKFLIDLVISDCPFLCCWFICPIWFMPLFMPACPIMPCCICCCPLPPW